MTEAAAVSFVINALLGLAMWAIKNTISSAQEDLRDTKKEIDHIKLNYLNKDEFREFKSELRGMFEEIKQDVKELKAK